MVVHCELCTEAENSLSIQYPTPYAVCRKGLVLSCGGDGGHGLPLDTAAHRRLFVPVLSSPRALCTSAHCSAESALNVRTSGHASLDSPSPDGGVS